jgi:AraC-like DNA-binding protein
LQAHLSISEICFRWGFNDAAHFSRAFREQFATTPRAWRSSQRADDVVVTAPSEEEQLEATASHICADGEPGSNE